MAHAGWNRSVTVCAPGPLPEVQSCNYLGWIIYDDLRESPSPHCPDTAHRTGMQWFSPPFMV